MAEGRTVYAVRVKTEAVRSYAKTTAISQRWPLTPLKKAAEAFSSRQFYTFPSAASDATFLVLFARTTKSPGRTVRGQAALSLPDALLEQALDCPQSIGVAFTYNEPLIGYEYVMDCAQLLKQNGQKVVLVTNGYINEEPLLSLLPFVDAMNIDLKGFTESFYKKLGGSLSPVKRTIELSAQYCHLEVTTLIVPGENDSEDEMRGLSGWLSGVGKDIPLHVSRYFPRHKMTDTPPTPLSTICALADVARASLRYVYEGNC